jgi:hypothetical protein
MTVRLQLQDGTVKEYPFGKGRPDQRTKCGATDCEHIDCAIEKREAGSRHMRLLAALLPFGTIFTVGMVYFLALDSSTSLFSTATIAIVVILDIFLIITFMRNSRTVEGQARELLEFREKKTVNGIPAQQLHETPPAR